MANEINASVGIDLKKFLDGLREMLQRTSETVKVINKQFQLKIDPDTSEFKKIEDEAKTAGKKIGDSLSKNFKVEMSDKTKKEFDESEKQAKKAGADSGKKYSDGFKSHLKNIGDFFAGGLLVSAFSAITRVGKQAVDEFIQLDKQIQNIGTIVDDSVNNFKDFGPAVTELAKGLTDTPAVVAEGVYQAISAGISGTNEEILAFVETASKAGVAGLSNTAEAVNGLTSVVNAYGLKADQAGNVSNTFFAAIKLGKTTFAELNASLANFVPTASAMGVSFEQSSAAIAQLTKMGTPTSIAATQMNAAFTLLQKGNANLDKALAKSGLTLQDLRDNLKKPIEEGGGLVNVMKQIKDSTENAGMQLAAVTGRVEAAKFIEQLAGSQEKYNNSLATTNQLQTEVQGGAAEKAFEVASQSIEVQLASLKNNLLAVVGEVLKGVMPAITELSKALVDMFNQPGVKESFAALGKTLGTVFSQLITVAAPILLQIFNLLTPILGAVGQLVGTLGKIVEAILPPILAILEPIINLLTPILTIVDELITGLLPPLKAILGQVGNIIQSLVVPLITALLPIISSLIKILNPILAIVGQLAGLFINLGIQALKPLIKVIEVVARVLNQVLEPFIGIAEMLALFINELFAEFNPIINELGELFGEVVTIVAEVLTIFLQLYALIVKEVLSAIGSLIASLFGVESAGDAFRIILNVIKVVLTEVIGFIKEAVEWVKNFANSIAEGVTSVLSYVGLVSDKSSKSAQDATKWLKGFGTETKKATGDVKTLEGTINDAGTAIDGLDGSDALDLGGDGNDAKAKEYQQLKEGIALYEKSINEKISNNQALEEKARLAGLIENLKEQRNAIKENNRLTEEQRVDLTYSIDRNILEQESKIRQDAINKSYAEQVKKEQELADQLLDKAKEYPEQQKKIRDNLDTYLRTLETKHLQDLAIDEEKTAKEIADMKRKYAKENDIAIAKDTTLRLSNELKLTNAMTDAQIAKRKELKKALLDIEYADVIAQNPLELTDSDLIKYQEYQGKLLEIDYKYNEEKVSMINDVNIRTRENGILEAEKERDAKLAIAGESADLRLQAETDYLKKVGLLQQDYLEKTDTLYTALQGFGNAFKGGFAVSENDNTASKQRIEDLNEEREILKKNLEDGKLSREQYSEEVKKLSKEENDIERENIKNRIDYQKTLLQGLAGAFQNIASIAQDSMNEALDSITQSMLALSDTSKLSAEQMTSHMENINDKFTEIAIASSAMLGATIATMAADGSANLGDYLKALATQVLDTMQAILAAYIPIIIAGKTIELPFVGFAMGLTEVAILQALLGVARGLVSGLYEGQVDIPLGRHKQGIDTIPARLTAGESVLTKRATMANKSAFEWANKTGMPLEKFFVQKFMHEGLFDNKAINVIAKIRKPDLNANTMRTAISKNEFEILNNKIDKLSRERLKIDYNLKNEVSFKRPIIKGHDMEFIVDDIKHRKLGKM